MSDALIARATDISDRKNGIEYENIDPMNEVIIRPLASSPGPPAPDRPPPSRHEHGAPLVNGVQPLDPDPRPCHRSNPNGDQRVIDGD